MSYVRIGKALVFVAVVASCVDWTPRKRKIRVVPSDKEAIVG